VISRNSTSGLPQAYTRHASFFIVQTKPV
jgi:hypothetical protein